MTTDNTTSTPAPAPGPAEAPRKKMVGWFIALVLACALVMVLIVALLMNIFERKQEAKNPFVRVVEVNNGVTDPAVWAKNWPMQYDSYARTAEGTRTRFGGHGGSEALP